jgi:hypothetical protein
MQSLSNLLQRLAESGVDFVVIGDKTCRLMGIHDLIRAKESLGREKDILAAKELRAIVAKRRRKAP